MIKTTSREISSELGSLLVENRYDYDNTFWIENDSDKIVTLNGVDYSKGYHVVFTMGELWDMLPNTICKENDYFELTICHLHPGYWVHYQSGNNIDYDTENHYNDTIIGALANCAIWCIENGHELNLPKNER